MNTKRALFGFSFLLLIFASAVFLSCTTDLGTTTTTMSSTTTTIAKTVEGLLKNLGIKEVENPPDSKIANTALKKEVTIDPEKWHPLKKDKTVFSPRAEILIVGAKGSDGNDIGYFKDSLSEYLQVGLDGVADQSWLQTSAKTSVAADIDGDGLAEAVIFYVLSKTDTKLYYRVYKGGYVSKAQEVSGVTLSGQSFDISSYLRNGMGSYWYPHLSSVRADYDGDGIDQIVFADFQSVYLISITGSKDSFTSRVDATKKYIYKVSSVGAGDIDGDRKDEIVVGMEGGQYAIYDGKFEKSITSPEIASLSGIITGVESAFGNFAGDDTVQLALAGSDNTGFGKVIIFSFDPTDFSLSSPVATVNVKNNPCYYNSGDADFYRLLPRAADLMGKGKDQLIALGNVYIDPLRGNVEGDFNCKINIYSENTIVDIKTGDIDNDGKKDMIIQSNGLETGAIIKVGGYNESNEFVEKKYFPDSSNAVNQFGTRVNVIMSNFEDNAVRVRYNGHKLTFTDPIVIAAIASAPYYDEISKVNSDYGGSVANWVTTFGTTETSGTSDTNSVGFSIGATVEYEQEFEEPITGLKLGKVGFEISFNNSFSWEFSNSYEVAKSVTYGCAGGEDRVIFTAVPIDKYEYIVEYSPTDLKYKVGDSLYINVPRDFNTYTVTRGFFNSHIDQNITTPIDNKVFKHTIGYPKTYCTSKDKNDLLTKYLKGLESVYQYGPKPVAEGSIAGSGTTNLSIAVTQGSEKSFTYNFSMDTSFGAGAGGWYFAVTAGFETGYSYTTSSSTSTQFGGTIGFLPTSYYENSNYTYKSGLFAYPYKASSNRVFWVVDYWVE